MRRGLTVEMLPLAGANGKIAFQSAFFLGAVAPAESCIYFRQNGTLFYKYLLCSFNIAAGCCVSYIMLPKISLTVLRLLYCSLLSHYRSDFPA